MNVIKEWTKSKAEIKPSLIPTKKYILYGRFSNIAAPLKPEQYVKFQTKTKKVEGESNTEKLLNLYTITTINYKAYTRMLDYHTSRFIRDSPIF